MQSQPGSAFTQRHIPETQLAKRKAYIMLHVVFLTIQTRLETIASQIKKTFAIEIGTYAFSRLVAVLSKNKKMS